MEGQSKNIFITPLGAGDLVDRAVRFYRKNFATFVLISLPVVVFGTVVSVGWEYLMRFFFSATAESNPNEMVLYYLSTSFGLTIIWCAEAASLLCVMGGASRNFVRHLLFQEKISFKATYANVWSRLGALIIASVVTTFLVWVVGGLLAYIVLWIGLIVLFIAVAALESVKPLAIIVGIFISIATLYFSGWIFFVIGSRFAYVTQSLLVEGRGAFDAIGRSISLARGNISRFAALSIFSIVATISALALLYIPLGWVAWSQGFDPTGVEEFAPGWFSIASQIVWQASFVLMMPVWTIGLCLLYVDERVRHEGYDLELMAAIRLGAIPSVPDKYLNPLQPALSEPQIIQAINKQKSEITTLGLK